MLPEDKKTMDIFVENFITLFFEISLSQYLTENIKFQYLVCFDHFKQNRFAC